MSTAPSPTVRASEFGFSHTRPDIVADMGLAGLDRRIVMSSGLPPDVLPHVQLDGLAGSYDDLSRFVTPEASDGGLIVRSIRAKGCLAAASGQTPQGWCVATRTTVSRHDIEQTGSPEALRACSLVVSAGDWSRWAAALWPNIERRLTALCDLRRPLSTSCHDTRIELASPPDHAAAFGRLDEGAKRLLQTVCSGRTARFGTETFVNEAAFLSALTQVLAVLPNRLVPLLSFASGFGHHQPAVALQYFPDRRIGWHGLQRRVELSLPAHLRAASLLQLADELESRLERVPDIDQHMAPLDVVDDGCAATQVKVIGDLLRSIGLCPEVASNSGPIGDDTDSRNVATFVSLSAGLESGTETAKIDAFLAMISGEAEARARFFDATEWKVGAAMGREARALAAACTSEAELRALDPAWRTLDALIRLLSRLPETVHSARLRRPAMKSAVSVLRDRLVRNLLLAPRALEQIASLPSVARATSALLAASDGEVGSVLRQSLVILYHGRAEGPERARRFVAQVVPPQHSGAHWISACRSVACLADALRAVLTEPHRLERDLAIGSASSITRALADAGATASIADALSRASSSNVAATDPGLRALVLRTVTEELGERRGSPKSSASHGRYIPGLVA